MKKVAVWVAMFFVSLVSIPLSWMINQHLPFNLVTNAFFNSSSSTIAFYFIQWILMIILTEAMIVGYEEKSTKTLKWANIFFLIAFIVMDFYYYYFVLAVCSFTAMAIISKERNKLKDDITKTLEDVKEEYSHQ